MSTYPLNELMRKWTKGDLSPEQAIGHILQHLNKMNDQMSSQDHPQPVEMATSGVATAEYSSGSGSGSGRRGKRNSM
jgi:hypothetical protein